MALETLARVLVDTGVFSLDREFYYKIPDSDKGTLKAGCIVTVPFGRGKKTGIVIGFTDEETDYELKYISAVKKGEPAADDKAIELAHFMQKMYIAPFFDCLKLLCPPGTFGKEDKKVRLINADGNFSPLQKKVLAFIEDEGGATTLAALKNEFGASVTGTVKNLEEKNAVETEKFTHKKAGVLKRKYVSLNMKAEDALALLPDRAVSQRDAVMALEKGDRPLAGFDNTSAIRALSDKGIVKIYDEALRRDPFKEKNLSATYSLHPTEEQKAALETINRLSDSGRAKTVLLHGVTGSGKTEVYMQAIERTVKNGRQAIVLVPEISLTPQMTDRFLGRFGENVAILHSMLSSGERLDEWMRIKNGEAKVVVGARSAIFAPLDNIGLIIVDEEHENTYKSEQTPRYDAIEVAKMRCRQHNALLILASATPSVTDYYKALSGKYELIKMTKRYNEVSLPSIEAVDMRSELKNGNRRMLSGRLTEEIRKNIENGEQTVLFLNRRGFSTFVSCRDCGYVALCPSCSIALVYHKNTGTLNCHYCGYKTAVMKTCPSCSSGHIKYFGTGTERLEEEIRVLFPSASVIRMDVDTTAGKNAHEKILKKFSEEKIDILLGTQMVSKGLDFPNISLVGVVAADMSLNIDDYRASERTFDLITQVCGRAGRGDTRGRAIIQTYSPENPVIEFAKKQDYEGFYESEIAYRKMFGYPPFSNIVCVSFSSADEKSVKEACLKIEKKFKELFSGRDIKLFASAPSPLYKIKGRYRWRFWFKGEADTVTRELLRTLYFDFKSKTVKMAIMIDPVNMA